VEIFFSPEVISPHFQALNVVDSKEKAVGSVALLFHEKKIYVYGILEEEGVGESFKDLVRPYLKGIAKAMPDTEIYACLYSGCKKIHLMEEEEKGK